MNKFFVYFWCGVCVTIIFSRYVCGLDLSSRPNIDRIDLKEGDTLTLACRAKSHLLRSYRWVYIREGTRKPRVLSSGRRLVVDEKRLSIDAKPVDKDVNLILTFTDIRPFEAGLFMCWRRGLKPDPQVHVRVSEVGTAEAEPVTITEIDGPSNAKYGRSATIKCHISPSWPGKVIWFKNGFEIDERDRVYNQKVEEIDKEKLVVASLELLSVRESANYTCKVPSSPPSQASFNVVIQVAKIEKLVSTPASDAIEYGQHLTISCLVSKLDTEVLWLKDGVNLEFNPLDTSAVHKSQKTLPDGTVQSALNIVSFSQKDNGQYVCYIPGNSKSLFINIEGRAPKIIGVKSWDFKIGDILKLTCSTQYNKQQKEITWLFEGQPLDRNWSPTHGIRYDVHNITHHDLNLPAPTSHHVGRYSCRAPFGSGETTVREMVPPEISETFPTLTSVKEGEFYTISCSVKGYPAPYASWEKLIDTHWKIIEEAVAEGEEGVENIEIKIELIVHENDTAKYGEKITLTIPYFVESNKGRYRCVGSNEEDEVHQETNIDFKLPEPEIVNISSDPVMEGEDLIITCTVHHPDGPVQFGKGFLILGQGDNPLHTVSLLFSDDNLSEMTFQLNISKAQVEDSGTYECSSGNEAQAFIDIAVEGAPSVIVEVAASLAVEKGEVFVSCSIENMFTDQQALFYFDGRNLNEEPAPKYSTYLATLSGESVVNERARAKLATYVLKVTDLTKEDSGVYRCVLDSEQKGSVNVEVEALANIETVNLTASVVWLGGDLTLKCAVTSFDGEVSFWHNNSLLLEEEEARYYLSQRQDGNETIHVLNIFDVTESDSGFYQCFTSPVMSSEINITIQNSDNIKLTLKKISEDSMVTVGSSMVLECKILGFKAYEHTVEISHAGRPYLYVDTSETGSQVNPRVTPIIDPPPVNESSLSYKIRVNHVEETDGGTWECRVTVPDVGFIIEDTAKIQVSVPPSFVDIPEEEIAPYEGDDVVLNCSAKGVPIPQLFWYKANEDIPLVNTTEFSQLKLYSITDNDAGTYSCVAISANSTISTQTILKITKKDILVTRVHTSQSLPIDEVMIVEMPAEELNLDEGQHLDLRCAANGTAPPFVMWLKEGVDEVLASGYDYVVYSIESATLEDDGEYICKATLGEQIVVEVTQLTIIQNQVQVEEDKIAVDTSSIGTSITWQPTTSRPVTTSTTTPFSTATFPPVIPTLMTGKLINLSGPERVELGSEFTLLCLVSPLLSKFEYLITFDNVILTLKDQISIEDPRMTIVTGTSDYGETMVGLKIQETKHSDAGTYTCTANTYPMAVDEHRIKVVPSGYLSSSTTGMTIETSEDVTDAMTSKSTILVTSTTMPSTISSPPFIEEIDNEYEEDSLDDYDGKVTVPTSYQTITDAVSGQNVSLICSTYILKGDIDPVYFWYHHTASHLLTAGPTIITSDMRFSVVTSKVHDESTSTLMINNVKEDDSGIYGCSLNDKKEFSHEQQLFVVERNDSITSTTELEPDSFSSSTSKIEEIEYHSTLSTTSHTDFKYISFASTTPEATIQDITTPPASSATHSPIVNYITSTSTELPFDIHHILEETNMTKTELTAEDEFETNNFNGELGEDHEENLESSVEEHQPVNETNIYEYDIDTFFEEEYPAERENDILYDLTTSEIVPETDEEDNSSSNVSEEEDSLEAIETDIDETTITSDFENEKSFTDYDSDADEELVLVSTEKTQEEPNVTESIYDVTENVEDTVTPPETIIVTEETPMELTTSSTTTINELPPSTTSFRYPIEDNLPSSTTTTTLDPLKGPQIEERPATRKKEVKKEEEIFTIYGIPGIDMMVPPRAQIILPCPTENDPDDITWKNSENLLFLGSLDLAGEKGLALSPEGELKLLSNTLETKDNKLYTCLVYDYDTYKDVPVVSYQVDLIDGDVLAITTESMNDTVTNATIRPPTSTYEFPGLEWQDVAVVSNSEVSGESLVKVLKEGGLNANLASISTCKNSSKIDGWEEAQDNLKECEWLVRSNEVIREDQSVFIMLDFSVSLPSNERYGSTLIYVHNVARKLRAHIFGPLVSLSTREKEVHVECGSRVEDSSHGVGLDLSEICKSSIASTILNLQETYLSHSRKLPMIKK